MTKFESYSLWINAISVVATIIIIIIAIWGERIKQLWRKPKLKILLAKPTFNTTVAGDKGWYYRITVSNERKSSPAQEVRLLLTTVLTKAPDGSWKESKFSGPTQVSWQWPNFTPPRIAVGQPECATFGCLLQGKSAFELKLYLYPNNLQNNILPNQPTRLVFQAVATTSESDTLIIEIAWDGKWAEGELEMAEHCIVKQITA